MTVLVPQMVKMFAKNGGTMPLPTFILIKISDGAHNTACDRGRWSPPPSRSS